MTGDILAGAGLIAVAGAAAVAIVVGRSRGRVAAIAVVVILAPALVFGDQWDSSLISDLRNDPGRLLALSLVALLVIGGLFALFRRWPVLLPLSIIAALPFRVPLHGGGDQANLLVPLYLVIAAGALLAATRDWRSGNNWRPGATGRAGAAVSPAGGTAWGGPPPSNAGGAGGGGSHAVTGPAGQGSHSVTGPAGRGPSAVTGPAGRRGWLTWLLAAFVVLYAAQALYSEDFSGGLQNVCFFFAPFALAFALLCDVRWDRRLLIGALAVVAAEALAFALVGFVEYALRDLIWNEAVIRSNEFHVYFRVNSLFWDPNVYGRYLATVIVLAVAALLWTRDRGPALALSALALVLWLALATTFSQSSFAALLAGLATLAALRWSLRLTLAVGGLAVIAAVAAVIAVGESFEVDLSTDNEVNKETTGRYNLVSGGIELFADRPLLGYGSGSFAKSFRRHVAGAKPPVSESHTEPVTVGAEQGLVGLAAFAALLITAFLALCAGLRDAMPGLRRGPPAGTQAASPAAGTAWGGPPPSNAGGGDPVPPAGGTEPGDRPEECPHRRGGGSGSVTGPAGQGPSPAPGPAVPAARAAILAAFVTLLVHTMAYAGFFEDPIMWVLLAVGASLSGGFAARPAP